MTPINSETLAIFKSTPGAISVHEALAIRWLAAQAPETGICTTLGANAGKDSIAACIGIQRAAFAYYPVDPVYDLANRAAWAESVQGEAEKCPWAYVNEPGFLGAVRQRLIDASDGRCSPVLIGMSARQWLEKLAKDGERIAYLFSDADTHDYGPIMAECALIEPLMDAGAILVFHDYGNYAGPVRAHGELLASGRWEDIAIPWQQIMRDASALGGEQGNNSWHCCDNPAPCHVAALRKLEPNLNMPTPMTQLPDGSGCFTATILSNEEAMALSLKNRPLCHRLSSEIYHATFEAIGEASMCWNPRPADNVFAAEQAEAVAVRLCFKIANEVESKTALLREGFDAAIALLDDTGAGSVDEKLERLRKARAALEGGSVDSSELNSPSSPPKGDVCPICGKPEVEAMTPRTVYACGSSDYDRRPGTFKRSEHCIPNP